MEIKYRNFITKSPSLPFRAIEIELIPNSQDTQNLIQKVRSRFCKISFNKADSSGENRDPDEIKYKSFTGLIVEQVCWEILKRKNDKQNIIIELDESNTAVDQIDLRIKKELKTEGGSKEIVEKTIEIRASFPHCIESAINENFDIIGPYQNPIKNIKEKEKDFYLRFLFELDYSLKDFVIYKKNNIKNYAKTSTNLLKNYYFNEDLTLKSNLFIYFVGGATNEMMNDRSIAYLGSMKSENFNQGERAMYKIIKIRNSLDSISILRLILGIHDKK